ncbi:putative WD repeat-containing protein C2A9.03 [Wolffia australiana]
MSVNEVGDEFEYMMEDDEMSNTLEEEIDEVLLYARGGEGYEEEDEYDIQNKVTDTSSAQARKGKDIQGIQWDKLKISRQDYRRTRVESYKNYENVQSSGELADKECKQVEPTGSYYDFQYNSRRVKPTILHFQLRNLVWATSKHDVYLISNNAVVHWSAISHDLSEVLNFCGHVAPCEKHQGSLMEGFSRTQVSTLAVRDNLLVAGGFQGELIFKRLDRPGVSFCSRMTLEDNAITNAIEIYANSSGSPCVMASNNDGGLRQYDAEKYQLLNHFRFPWPVNHTSISPDGRLVTVVGDHCEGLLVDSRDGKVVSRLVGHRDFSFSSAWHPGGVTFATGNQDKTCRVWDTRNLSSAVSALKGNLGAIRSIRYSSDGQFLMMAEPADFVHIYSTKQNYERRQEIDFFGEISGFALSPDDESLFVGVWDRIYASLIHYNRRHVFKYLDSYL